MSLKAAITRRGAILLGENVACDAFEETRPFRVVTHAHADHTVGLRQSLRKCGKVLMTEATRDMLEVMGEPLSKANGNVQTLPYNRSFQIGSESLTLCRADHILGAAQVLVEDEVGTRIVYTGDFRIDETPVLDSDVLVMESTYGNPYCRRPFKKDVNSLLVSLVEKGLKHGSVYVFGFHGKLQEVMQILREARIKVPFVAPEKVFNVSQVSEQHGMRIGTLYPSEGKEGREMLENNSCCVAFYHTGARSKVGLGSFRIFVSGWEFGSPCRRTGEREYVVALSDHSDFNGLIEYVRRSKPRFVITDNYRDGHAEVFVKELRRRFMISAMALPQKQTL